MKDDIIIVLTQNIKQVSEKKTYHIDRKDDHDGKITEKNNTEADITDWR